MSLPDCVTAGVESEFGLSLTAQEAEEAASPLELHRVILRRLAADDPASAMAVWKRVVKVVEAALKPRFSFEMQPYYPFAVYESGPLPLEACHALQRRELAEVLISFMRGELGSDVVTDQMHILGESGFRDLQALGARLAQIAEMGDAAPIAVSARQWAWLRRLVAALLAGLPLEPVTVKYRPAEAGEVMARFALEPFWTSGQWQRCQPFADGRGLLEQPTAVAPDPPVGGLDRGCLSATLVAAFMVAAIFCGFRVYPLLWVPAAAVVVALLTHVALHWLVRSRPRSVAVMIGQEADDDAMTGATAKKGVTPG